MNDRPSIELPGRYHLVGVGGVGMSAVAQALAATGAEVSGSDRYRDSGEELDVFPKLVRAGIRLVPQDGSGVEAGLAGVVVSTAIEDDNPDLVAAGRMGVRVLHRSEALAGLVRETECVAVTGTSGKSTVTGMAGWILTECGRDPTVVNGAAVLNWRDEYTIGNFRKGGSELWVVEADESDRTLLRLTPDRAIVTNASRDHFELDETMELFERFSDQVRTEPVSTLRDPGLLENLNIVTSADGCDFKYGSDAFHIPVPGRHNAANAVLAIELCRRLGVKTDAIARALESYGGIHRRLEKVGNEGGVVVFDDYAHNPAKIDAAWSTVAEHYGRVIGIWRPHGFGPLRAMMDGLEEAFRSCCGPSDILFLLPVYDAGGTADRSVGSDQLVGRLGADGIDARCVTEPDALPGAVAAEARDGDVVLVMGARDPGLPTLARAILASLNPDD